jgi:trehalose synthase
MLRTLPPYWRGDGIDARWLVLEAPRPYFLLTKRLHNLLYGVSDGVPTASDRRLYEWAAAGAGAAARKLVAPGDVVILEDPQTAGLAPELRAVGAAVIWRCHVGCGGEPEAARSAWRFLMPFIKSADALAFTRAEHIPVALQGVKPWVLRPAIDPLSTKNEPLPPTVVDDILQRCGLAERTGASRPVRVELPGGDPVVVRRRCGVLREGSPPQLGADRLVVALGRWDRLKDPIGILRAFADFVQDPNARLILAGPASDSIPDDPGARTVLRETHRAWHRLPIARRRRIDIATLPMVDLDENALMVNALQRRADVIVKKSLQEGFGLGVTEGLWKARPVVATGVGGHMDQIEHGRTSELGHAGREFVRRHFLPDQHLVHCLAALRYVLRIRFGPGS